MKLIFVKSVFITFALIFLSTMVYSQDLIILNNGQRVKVKVIEKTASEIKYKNYSHQDGPVYNLDIEKINKIIYEDGEVEEMVNKTEIEIAEDGKLSYKRGLFGLKYYNESQEISKNRFMLKLRENESAHQKFEEGKNLGTIGNILGLPSGLIFGYNIGTMLRGGKTSREVNIISGIAWGASVILEITGNVQMKKGINEFNASQDLGFKFKYDNNSIGLVIDF